MQNIELRRLEIAMDFYQFCLEFWDVVVKEPYVYEWYHEYICEQLQEVGERVITRQPKLYDMIINIPPGHSKTTFTTIMFPCWLLLRNPKTKIINASYSQTLSQEAVLKSRDILKSEQWKLYFPEIKIRKDKDNKANFELIQGGGRLATSVGGTVTGFHAHLLLVDDPLSAQQAFSLKETETANQWFDTTVSTRTVDPKITPLITIMQRLSFNDCSAHLLAKKKTIKHICLPSEDKGFISPQTLKKNYINGLLSPNRFDSAVLETKKTDLGSFIYAGQFLQMPAPLEGGKIKKSWFSKIDKAKFEHIFSNYGTDKIAVIDSSEGLNGKSDKTGIMIGCIINGLIYIEYFYHVRLNIIETINELDKMLIKYMNPYRDKVYIEFKSNGSAIKALTDKENKKFRLIPYKYPTFKGDSNLANGNKYTRTIPLLGKLEAKTVILVENDSNDEFLYQVTNFPASGIADEAIDNLDMIMYKLLVAKDNSKYF